MVDFAREPLWAKLIDGGFMSGGFGTLNCSTMQASERMSLNEERQLQHSGVLL